MEIRTIEEKRKLIICLDARIDQTNAAETEAELFKIIGEHPDLTTELDASGLSYISSAGLRVLLKLQKSVGETIGVRNTSPEVYDIFDTTGFTQILDIRRQMREISVEGCEIIGKGFFGTVYRLDSETIVKVYQGEDSIPLIENEKRMAQKAFLAGIPTAISYDIVRVGENYGSVFELLNARTFHDLVLTGERPVEEVVRRYVELLKVVHRTRMKAGDFPSCRERYLEYLEVIRIHLTDRQYEGLKQLFTAMREETTVVHGDIQMKNALLVEDEPMLIDMDTLSLGNPVFEMAALYVTYQEFEEDDPGNAMAFLGMTQEMVDDLFRRIMEEYFDFADDAQRESTLAKIRLIAAVRFLYLLETTDLKNNEFGAIRIRHTGEHIDELLEVVDQLMI